MSSRRRSKRKNVDLDEHRFRGKTMLDWSIDLPPPNATYVFLYCDEHHLHWSLIKRGNEQQMTSWRTDLLPLIPTHEEPSELLSKMMPKGINNYFVSLEAKAKYESKHTTKIYIYYLDPASHACTNGNHIIPTNDNGEATESQSILLSKLFASSKIPCLQYFLTQDDFSKLSESLPLTYDSSLDFYEYSCFQYCSMTFSKPFLMVYTHFKLSVTSILYFEPELNPQGRRRVVNIQRFNECLSASLGTTSDIAKALLAFSTKYTQVHPDSNSSSNTFPNLVLVGNNSSNIKRVLKQSNEWKQITKSFHIVCLKRAFSLGIHALFDAKRDDLRSMLDSSIDESSHRSLLASGSSHTKENIDVKRKAIENRIRIAKDFSGIGISYGTVKGVDIDHDGEEVWFVQYDDGDSEDFTSSDLEMARFFYDSLKGAQSIQRYKNLKKSGIVERDAAAVNMMMKHSNDTLAKESMGHESGTNLLANSNAESQDGGDDEDDFHELEVHI